MAARLAAATFAANGPGWPASFNLTLMVQMKPKSIGHNAFRQAQETDPSLKHWWGLAQAVA